ncbi:MAG: ABC transporter ATP-binding protein [Bacteroidales bacterium]|nr:ABC transporter ATP-binding protein [Bacteroidales bacterium]
MRRNKKTMGLLHIDHFSLELSQDTLWKPILRDISFSMEKGETIGIVGESGSGKSVTALSIMGLIDKKKSKITSGNIVFFDQEKDKSIDLTTLTEEQYLKIRGKKIAMIFQEPMTSLNPVIKCGEQICEAILLHEKLSKKRVYQLVIKLLNEVMLPRPEEIFDSYPHELSGGQKQRVMIAMAMSCHPDILIADEPTTALDVTVQKGILELIRNLQQKHGMSVIFITHDLGVVAEIADRVLVLYKGEIVESGKVNEVLYHPEHPYTKGLLSCRPPLDVRPKLLLTVKDFMEHYDAESRTSSQIMQELVSDEERKISHERLYSQKPIIKIEGLSKSYPIRNHKLFAKKEYVHALQNVNVDIYEGETLGLVGESGCGKTTLGRSMIRLIEPTEGKVIYKGHSLTELSNHDLRKVRKDLQIILQDPYSSLNQRLTVGSSIMEPMKVHHLHHTDKERKQKAIELLERVDLNESHFYRYPHEFSGGQRQRISIARALAVNPTFIICDESVSALDVSVQAQVLNLLNELKKEYHFTYIFISHDLSVVKFMSDRMAVMRHGQIVEINEADKIYQSPQTEYTRQLIAAIPNVDEVWD